MIKDALVYLMEKMSPANINEIKGEVWADRPMHRISYIPKADPIELNTLTSLVDYLKSNTDTRDKLIVHVKSPTKVLVYSCLNIERERERLVEVNALLPDFRFNQFIDHEEFCIGLQSKFLESEDRALLLKFAGTVEAGSVASYGDDGVTQKATIKTGVASKSDALVPNPVELRSFRTFIEVEQPLQQFIFRMMQSGSGAVRCALFEADGGAWKLEAMKAISDFLKQQLADVGDLVIIS